MPKQEPESAKFDIRNILIDKLKTMKRTPIINEANIRPGKMSLFLNQMGGMDFHSGIRLLIASGFRLMDEKGTILLGNPETRDQELQDNTLKNIAV